MDEKIYDLLNNVQMNLDEYEETELSSKEKQKIRKRLLQKVRHMKKNNKSAFCKRLENSGSSGSGMSGDIRYCSRNQPGRSKGAFGRDISANHFGQQG